MSTPWLLDGKKVWANSTPLLCDECPCEEEPTDCSGRIISERDRLLAIVDAQGHHPWSVMASWIGSYTCATITYDSATGTATVVTPASGNLVVIGSFAATGTGVSSSHVVARDTCTLRNDTTGEVRTLYCTCEYQLNETRTAYVCTMQYDIIDDYVAMGAADVDPGDTYDTQCQVDACSAYKAILNWHWRYNTRILGAKLYGEGYTEYNGGVPETPYYRAALVYSYTETEGGVTTTYRRALAVTCDCSAVTLDMTIREYYSCTGLCDDECPYLLSFLAQTKQRGQTVLREGYFLVRNGHEVYDEETGIPSGWEWEDTYAGYDASWPSGVTFLAARYESDGTLTHIPCGCPGIITTSYSDFSWHVTVNPPTDGKPAWFASEYAGACTCIDWREVALEYPEKFGIIDTIYGSNFTLTDDPTLAVYTGEDYQGHGGWIDYDALCVIQQLGSSSYRLVIFFSQETPGGLRQWERTYTTAPSFSGQYEWPEDWEAGGASSWKGNVVAEYRNEMGGQCGVYNYFQEPPPHGPDAGVYGTVLYVAAWVDTNRGVRGWNASTQSYELYGAYPVKGIENACMGHSQPSTVDYEVTTRGEAYGAEERKSPCYGHDDLPDLDDGDDDDENENENGSSEE